MDIAYFRDKLRHNFGCKSSLTCISYSENFPQQSRTKLMRSWWASWNGKKRDFDQQNGELETKIPENTSSPPILDIPEQTELESRNRYMKRYGSTGSTHTANDHPISSPWIASLHPGSVSPPNSTHGWPPPHLLHLRNAPLEPPAMVNKKLNNQKGNASIYELLINTIQCNNDIIHHNTNNTMWDYIT